MRNGLTITFKDVKHTDHLIQFIENKFRRQKKMHAEIIQCKVTVSAPHRQHRSGNARKVTIHTSIPGRTLTAKRFTDQQTGVDLYGAVSDAFLALETQLDSRGLGRLSYKNFRCFSHQYSPQFSD